MKCFEIYQANLILDSLLSNIVKITYTYAKARAFNFDWLIFRYREISCEWEKYTDIGIIGAYKYTAKT